MDPTARWSPARARVAVLVALVVLGWASHGPLDAAAGVTPPGPATTGVPPDVRLVPSGPIRVQEDGRVLEGLDVEGCVVIAADRVVIRRSRIRCTRPAGERAAFGIDVESGRGPTLVEDVEIDGGGDPWVIGIRGPGVTVRRSNIHGVGDGIKATSGGRYLDNWIHDLADGPDQHNDGIQMSQGRGVVVRGNRIVVATTQTSAVLVKSDLGPIADVRIVDNWLEGGTYTVYVIGRGPAQVDGGSDTPHGAARVTVEVNRFGRDFRHGLVQVRAVVGFAWGDNVWADTGAPVGPVGDDGSAPAAGWAALAPSATPALAPVPAPTTGVLPTEDTSPGRATEAGPRPERAIVASVGLRVVVTAAGLMVLIGLLVWRRPR